MDLGLETGIKRWYRMMNIMKVLEAPAEGSLG